MQFDVIFPKGNEKEFALMAKKLGYNCIIFAYSSFEEIDRAEKSLSPNLYEMGVHHHRALYINANNKNNVVSKIKKARKRSILSFVVSKDPVFDRFVVEKSGANALVNPEYLHAKDHLHFRRSGLDQVICRFAREKKVIFLNSLSELMKSVDKSIILGRIMQNLRLCSKYKCSYNVVSFANKPLEMKGAHDLEAFLKVLKKKLPY